jgi:integrase/recombinase XerD
MSTIIRAPVTLAGAAPEFLLYAEVELGFAKQSLVKYADCLRQVERMLGSVTVTSVSQDDVLQLKSAMLRRNLSVSRQVSILCALKRLLQFWTDKHHGAMLDPALIIMPRRPRRQVDYLTADEVERFVRGIRITSFRDKTVVSGLRFRALVEALLGSGMRIGELLSLNRTDIDFQRGEARVVGKGNKQRTVFFTGRALEWLSRYLAARHDKHSALFVCQGGQARLARTDIWRPFNRHRVLAGIHKKVTPHLLRHTAATQLLFNGCPIGHIKEILGHERLETTCRYYLGLDNRAAKRAFNQYLTYAASYTGESPA